jgi:hypothetical protein
MLNKIIHFSLQNRILVLVASVLLLYTVTDVLALSLRLTEHNTLPYNYYLEKLHSTCLPHVKGLRAPPCDVLA